jgi:filamentous hemagglutinin family protein
MFSLQDLLNNRTSNRTFTWLISTPVISVLLLATAFISARATTVNAQSITGANDGTGTTVEQDQNTMNINGGTQTGNNLFHSFEQFGLTEGQAAVFFANPETSNILGRVVGNEASIIDGLIQVNSNANLFLMNPAGIVFGENANLNVAGDFTATTATGIGFGTGNFFNAYGENDLTLLTGTPLQFAFDASDPNSTPGVIVNRGNLVAAKNITLLGGRVDSPGTISSSQGDITISAVPNSSLVTIEQAGNLLSLAIDPPRDPNGEVIPFSAEDLPELLTGKVNEDSAIAVQSVQGQLSQRDIEVDDPSQNPDSREQNASSSPGTIAVQSLADEVTSNTSAGELVGIDLDGDGVPDVPIETRSQTLAENNNETVSTSNEVVTRVNSDVLNNSDSETADNLQQLENSSIVYQPREQDSLLALDRQVRNLDETFSQDYQGYYAIFDEDDQELDISLAQIQQVLQKIERATGAKPAVIYAAFYPTQISSTNHQSSILPQPDDELELVAITAEGEPVRRRVTGAERTEVEQIARRFTDTIISRRPEAEFLPQSQQLYQWLVKPLANDLKAREIDNLVFILEGGMRSLPFAALHDGKKYLVEEYSVGMMPSFRLTNTIYQDIRDVELLAMGSETFKDRQLAALPAVPVELNIVAQDLWAGTSFLNEDFTIANLKQTQNSNPFGILHLATHAEFLPGKPANSFIQFGDRKLKLSEVRELGLNNPEVELIVLSACKTAVGDRDAEYGFASLAYQAGVKSALGSLWSVSDAGTLALMSNFYRELKDAPIKAEALRLAQVAMINHQVRIKDDKLVGADFQFDLPAAISENEGEPQLAHPYYWSAFSLVGNPW